VEGEVHHDDATFLEIGRNCADAGRRRDVGRVGERNDVGFFVLVFRIGIERKCCESQRTFQQCKELRR
jgi:hypothetical protein